MRGFRLGLAALTLLAGLVGTARGQPAFSRPITIKQAGVTVGTRQNVNLVTGASCVDTPSTNSVDCTFTGGSATPSAPTNSIQFNSSGAFGGDADLLWNSGTNTMTLQDGVLSLTATGATAGSVRFVEPSGGANFSAFKAGVQTTDQTYTWPDPTTIAAGDFLQTDAAGVLTWAASAGSAHNFLSATHPDTVTASPVLGDIVAANATPAWARVAGNITTTKNFLRQTGTGAVSAVPVWDTISPSDLPGSTVDATPAGTSTQLAYFLDANTITSEVGVTANALTWDQTVNALGIGTATPLVRLHAVVTSGEVMFGDIFNASATGAQIIGRHARGTEAAPTATQVNDVLLAVGGRGYGATAFASGSRALLNLFASETWTDTAQGAYAAVNTTPVGSVTAAERVRFSAAGELLIGTQTSPTGGALLRNIGSSFLPTIYGSESSAGNLTLQSTTHATKGMVVLADAFDAKNPSNELWLTDSDTFTAADGGSATVVTGHFRDQLVNNQTDTTATIVSPANASCTGADAPYLCCSGAGTGTCLVMANPSFVFRAEPNSSSSSIVVAATTDESVVSLQSSGALLVVASAPTAGGTGYALNDVLTLTSGTGTVTVTGVSGGVVTAVTLTTAGVNNHTGAGQPTTGGTGTGCTINVTSVVALQNTAIFSSGASWYVSVLLRAIGPIPSDITVEALYDDGAGNPAAGTWRTLASTTTNTRRMFVAAATTTGITTPFNIWGYRVTLGDWTATGTAYLLSAGLHHASEEPWPAYARREMGSLTSLLGGVVWADRLGALNNLQGPADQPLVLRSGLAQTLVLRTNNSATNRLVVASNGNVGVGNITPATLFDVNNLAAISSTGTIGAGTTAPTARFHGVTDAGSAAMQLDSYGTGFSSASRLRASRGTVASPSGTISGDSLGTISWIGMPSDTLVFAGSSAIIRALATENHISTGLGAKLEFITQVNGGASGGQVRATILNGGEFLINAATTPNSEKLNVAGHAAIFPIGGVASELRLYEPAGTEYTSFKSPVLAANVDYTLPTALGAAGSTLTDAAGTGTLSWVVPSGAGTVTSVAGGVGITNSPEPIIGAGTVDLDINSLTTETVVAAGDLFAYVDVSVGTTPASQRKVTFGNIEAALTLSNMVGPLSLAKGGTGAAITGVSGGLVYLSSTTTMNSSGLMDASEIVLGGGAGAAPTTTVTGGLGTTTQVLHGNAAGVPAWGAVSLTADVSGTLPFGNGGTGQTTAILAFNALSPSTTLGDLIYHDGTNDVRLAGNITTAKQFLTQTGTGAVSAAPVWGALAATDLAAHVLADTTGLGAQHTTSGLTAGQVLRATAATTAAFQSLIATDLPAHVLATNVALGSQHTISGTASGQVLRASSASAANFQALTAADITAGAALTKTDDTNVTLTLGGAPTTALLSATSLTLGWTGTLSLARGGSGAAITGVSGGIPFFSSTTAMASSALLTASSIVLGGGAGATPTTGVTGGLGTTTQVLHGNAAGAPSWAAIADTDLPSLTSAQWATHVSDETGTGLWVFNNTPTLTTPTINTVNGSTSPSGTLILNSTSNATKGTITLDGTVVSLQNSTAAGAATELRLFEPSNGADFTSFKSPALASSVSYTLPPDDGTASQFLQTDGAGVLSWQTPSGSGNTTSSPAGTNTQLAYFTAGTTITSEAGTTVDALTWDATNNRLGVATPVPSFDVSLGEDADRTIGVQRETTAVTAGRALTVSAGGALLAGTNLAGGNATLASGIATGTGSSLVLVQAAGGGSTGTAESAPATLLSIGRVSAATGGVRVGIGDPPGLPASSPLTVTTTLTSAAVGLNLINANLTVDPTGAASQVSRGYLTQISVPAANAQNFTGIPALVGGRLSATFAGTGTLSELVAADIFSNIVSTVTNTWTTVEGAMVEARNNGTGTGTRLVTMPVVASQQAASTITTMKALHATAGISNASSIVTDLRVVEIGGTSHTGVNLLSAGTATNPVFLFVEGFPTGGTAFTTTPEQVRLDTSAVATIGLRQLGAANTHNRLQGNTAIGVDATPTTVLQVGASGTLGTIGIGGSTSGLLTVRAAATTTGHTLTFPGTQGANETMLRNDGSGALTWSANYAALTGRAGGQTLQGGTGNGENLTLQSTAGMTKGVINASDPIVVANQNTGGANLTSLFGNGTFAATCAAQGTAGKLGLMDTSNQATDSLRVWRYCSGTANGPVLPIETGTLVTSVSASMRREGALEHAALGGL